MDEVVGEAEGELVMLGEGDGRDKGGGLNKGDYRGRRGEVG